MTYFDQNLTSRNYTVKVGQYFGRGWEIFKQYAVPFVGFVIFIGLFSFLTSLLPAPLGSAGKDKAGVGLISSVLNPIFLAGIYIVAFKVAKGRLASFSDFFQGFNNFIQLFLTNFVANLLIAIGIVLLVIPGIYLAVAYIFAVPLAVDKHLDFWNALETSRRLITKNWFSFLGLSLLLFLLNLGGLLLLGVGLLITVPWSFCTIAAAYEDIVGLNGTDD